MANPQPGSPNLRAPVPRPWAPAPNADLADPLLHPDRYPQSTLAVHPPTSTLAVLAHPHQELKIPLSHQGKTPLNLDRDPKTPPPPPPPRTQTTLPQSPPTLNQPSTSQIPSPQPNFSYLDLGEVTDSPPITLVRRLRQLSPPIPSPPSHSHVSPTPNPPLPHNSPIAPIQWPPHLQYKPSQSLANQPSPQHSPIRISSDELSDHTYIAEITAPLSRFSIPQPVSTEPHNPPDSPNPSINMP